jgi:DNA-binding transcriptional LysR family regulator
MIIMVMITFRYYKENVMDIKQIQTFQILSEELNFTRAADKLGYTQSCITQHIRKLEEELGVSLFDRIGKKVTLTEAGNSLIPYASQLLKIIRNFHDFSKAAAGETGTIKIGVCDSLCMERMPAIIKAFKMVYPNVDIYLKILKCSEFLDELRDNKIDLAYTIGYLNKIPEIQFTAEKVEPILVLAAPGDPLTEKKNLGPKDFDGTPLIMAEPAAYYRKNFLIDLERNGINPKVILETESIQAIINLTESGLGVCVLPKTAAGTEIRAGRLIPLDYSCDYDIRSQVIWHRDKWLSLVLKEFILIAEEEINRMCTQ